MAIPRRVKKGLAGLGAGRDAASAEPSRTAPMLAFNFSEETRSLLTKARYVAVERQHAYVGTEHLLLAMVAERNALLAAALERAGRSDLGALQRMVDGIVKPGPSPVDLATL